VVAEVRAQATACLYRLNQLVASNRLDLATGSELSDLIQSEFGPLPQLQKIQSVGEAYFTRTGTAAGVIKAGTRFNRKQIPVTTAIGLAVPEASYVSTVDVPVAVGQLNVTIPLIAASAGLAGNQPWLDTQSTAPIVLADALFDTSFAQVGSFICAGGSDGFTNRQLRDFARAIAIGQYAPNTAAFVAGCLNSPGIKKLVPLDLGDGSLYGLVADGSWATSIELRTQTKQYLHDNEWVWYGSSVDLFDSKNKLVGVNATIIVSDPKYLNDTTSIETAVRKALTDYFDNRPDWYLFRTSSMQSIVAQCSDRILGCSSLTVTDLNGVTIVPPLAPSLTTGIPFKHFVLNNNLNFTYLSPT
jgi:Baseplate J-like protein